MAEAILLLAAAILAIPFLATVWSCIAACMNIIEAEHTRRYFK